MPRLSREVCLFLLAVFITIATQMVTTTNWTTVVQLQVGMWSGSKFNCVCVLGGGGECCIYDKQYPPLANMGTWSTGREVMVGGDILW